MHPHPVSVDTSCDQSNCCYKKLQGRQALQDEASIYVEAAVSYSQKASHCKGLGEIIWWGTGSICSGAQLTCISTDNYACARDNPAGTTKPWLAPLCLLAVVIDLRDSL